MPNEDVSNPLISFFDKTSIPQQNRTFGLPRPSVGGFVVDPFVDRRVNRVETGATQTFASHARDEFRYHSEFLSDADAANIRALWHSTQARETFTFKRHGLLTTFFPSASVRIHDNEWIAAWRVGYDKLQLTPTQGMKGVWTVNLEMEGFAILVG